VLLYGVFDGTSHLMLQQLAFAVDNALGPRPRDPEPVARAAGAWSAAPRPLHELGRPAPAVRTDYVQLARAYAERGVWPVTQTLPELARGLNLAHRALHDSGAWSLQSHSFELAEVAAWIEVVIATVELGDPGVLSLLERCPAREPVTALCAGAALIAQRAALAIENLVQAHGADAGPCVLPLGRFARDAAAAQRQLTTELTNTVHD
jgi:hypothetical protein